MSTTRRMTFIGMYNYDSTLFDSLTFPEGVDKSTAVNTFLLNYGECRVLYPDPDFTKAALAVWSLKNAEPISRIVAALDAEYNPIHNFDRHEEYSDTELTGKTTDYTGTESESHTGYESTSHSGTEDTTYTIDQSTENLVSAYNASTYQESTKSVDDGENKTEMTRDLVDSRQQNLLDSRQRNLKDQESGNRRLSHEGHLYGNIGVTKSQEMVRDEVELRTTLAIYDIIADMLHRDFCLYYY